MMASVGSEPGPTPSMKRPRVRWSSCTARSATMYGLWYATLIDAGAELDVAGPLGRRGDEDLRRGDDLGAGGVVLADPGFVPAELVEVGDELEVALDGQRRVLPGSVERRHEDAEAQTV